MLGELGHGGMAVVYRARDPRLDRDVAVKVLHPHLARDAESRARFEREARAAARLRHPGIVEVYEFSDANERESYMVTELLEGPTLRRFAEQHPGMPAEVAAAVGIVLCDALACAHAQGVVHRDVKPDNMMLQRGGRLKLTDFGIAHVADAREMTATGQMLGSPAHMAPEQVEGTPVDARTDLFAAGTVLYLLSVGRLPFDGTTAHALLRRILEGEYTDPVRANPAVGERFARVLRKAMARRPEDRYPDAAAMRADLVDYVAEVGWDQPERELTGYFSAPEGFMSAHRERLLERLPELGVEARERGDVPAAMGYFNRALALDPGNPRVLALVRSVARRRAMARRLRAAGIVAAVAVATMGAVLVTARLRPRSSPRVVPTVLSPLPESEAETGPVTVARGTEHPVAVPTEPDASATVEPETPTVVRPRVHRTAAVSDAGTVRGAVPGAVQGAVQGVVATRELQLLPIPHGVWYSVDGRAQVQWSMQHPSLGSFPVGHRVHLEVVPMDPVRFQSRTYDLVVVRGDPDAGVQRVGVTLPEQTRGDATAAVAPDAGPAL